MPRTTTKKAAPSRRRKKAEVIEPANLCGVCGKAAELGAICDACTATINSMEVAYISALSGSRDAQAALKKLTPDARRHIVPTVLSDEDKATFIEKGIITGGHQAAVSTVKKAATKEEPKMTTRTAKTTRRRKATPTGPGTKGVEDRINAAITPTKTKKAAAKEGITAAQVARENGIDGRAFRAFLRSQNRPRQFKTNAEARKAVTAFKKAAS